MVEHRRTRPRDDIERVAAMLDERADTIGALEALDSGKPLRDAIDNVHSASAAFRYWTRLAQDLRTPVMPTGARSLNYSLREPVGVVGIITPWNFPMLLYAEHLPGAGSSRRS
jgi:acyl-CoA reductase-like NAD-dependent aldehyde dehydrogenase